MGSKPYPHPEGRPKGAAQRTRGGHAAPSSQFLPSLSAAAALRIADELLVTDFVWHEPGPLVARARRCVRCQSEQAQARDPGAGEMLLERRQQLLRDPPAAKFGHHTDVGDVPEAVRLRGLGDM